MPVRSVCVYCGSSSGHDPVFASVARDLGARLVAEGLRLVYGGGAVGLMGILADEVLANGGEAVGVIPHNLFSREIAHSGLTELHQVGSMHERKALMFDLADAFVALPGGLGTLEEVAEITTWAQLGLHRAPIVLFDVNDFWQPLVDLLDRSVREGFLRQDNRALLARVTNLDALLVELRRERPAPAEKWIDAAET
jgi:uncharacterized protein (TIGR00730 family)